MFDSLYSEIPLCEVFSFTQGDLAVLSRKVAGALAFIMSAFQLFQYCNSYVMVAQLNARSCIVTLEIEIESTRRG